ILFPNIAPHQKIERFWKKTGQDTRFKKRGGVVDGDDQWLVPGNIFGIVEIYFFKVCLKSQRCEGTNERVNHFSGNADKFSHGAKITILTSRADEYALWKI